MRHVGIAALLTLAFSATEGSAGVKLVEKPGQSTAVRAVVQIEGTIRTPGSGGKTRENPLTTTAKFGFLETRLDDPAIGDAIVVDTALQDPSQLRAVRNYIEAEADITVAGRKSSLALPGDSRRIVVEGRASGPIKFSPTSLLMRDSVDLLDMPGDPLALVALLPPDQSKEYEIGDSWTPADWAAQMLCSIDASAKTEITCTLKSIEGSRATIEVTGRVEGARLGAYSKINVAGLMAIDTTAQLITSASFNYSESSEIGTITPGVLSTTSVRLARQASGKPVSKEGVPVSVPPEALQLYYDAGSWATRFQHGRDWHIYYAQLDEDPKVIILRRLDGGNLQCQCNLALIPPASPGSHTPLTAFETDIRKTLGDRFESIVSRDEIPGTGGVRIFRTEVSGRFATDDDKPITWTYYLIAAPDGRQLSAIFAFEPDTREKLGDEDQRLVRSIEFLDLATAKKSAAQAK